MEDPLYREIILEHWQNPQNYGTIQHPDFDVSAVNPSCGDEIRITGKITNGKISDIKFISSGCAVSKASASLLIAKIKGQPVSKLKKLKKEDVLQNLPVEISPARHTCALLCFMALQKVV